MRLFLEEFLLPVLGRGRDDLIVLEEDDDTIDDDDGESIVSSELVEEEEELIVDEKRALSDFVLSTEPSNFIVVRHDDK